MISDKIIQVDRLKKYYPINENRFGTGKIRNFHAVDDLSLVIDQGEIYGIVGESGCGKSTLGRSILRLTDITGGKIYFKGIDITAYPQHHLKKYGPKCK